MAKDKQPQGVNKGTKDLKKNNPISNRGARRRNRQLSGKNKPHLSTESKEAKLATHNAASTYYNLYLREKGQKKAFQVWLSKVIDAPEKDAVKWRFFERIGHYFIQVLRALFGRL